MDATPSPYVKSLAIRTAQAGPMQETTVATVQVDGGLEGDLPVTPDRGVTFLSAEHWEDVLRQLDLDLPWHTRRANVLVAGTTLGHWIGRTVRLGEVEVEIEAETTPCGLMDMIQPGLLDALVPDCRGGVYGRVRRGGVLRVGEHVELLAE